MIPIIHGLFYLMQNKLLFLPLISTIPFAQSYPLLTLLHALYRQYPFLSVRYVFLLHLTSSALDLLAFRSDTPLSELHLPVSPSFSGFPTFLCTT